MDAKLAMLFVLIGTIIGLSHLGDENLAKLKRLLARWSRREMWPHRRKP
jgi:hypothetical protein